MKAIFSGEPRVKQEALSGVMLCLEQSAVLWRLAQDRRWISQQQLVHVAGRLDEAGRMANGWKQQQSRRQAEAK